MHFLPTLSLSIWTQRRKKKIYTQTWSQLKSMLTLSRYSLKRKALFTTLNRTKYFKFRVKSKVLNHTYAQEVRKKFIKGVRKYLTKTKSSQIPCPDTISVKVNVQKDN